MHKGKETRKIISFANRIVRRQMLITLLSLLICGLLFLIFMMYKLNQPIINDINYYLKTTNNEINTKTDILSSAVIKLRSNNIVIDYLNSAATKKGSQQEMGRIFHEFFHDTGIHSENNLAEGGKPFMDAVFLFDNNGNNLGAHYDSMQSLLVEKKEMKFQSLYDDFSNMESKSKLSSLLVSDEENIYVCQNVHNDNFDLVGRIIFSINKKALSFIINRGANYPNIIWYLTDENGRKLQLTSNDKFTQSDLHDMISKNTLSSESIDHLDSYLYDIKNTSMNMYSIIVLSKSHTYRLLLSNIWVFIVLIVVIAMGCAFFMFWLVKKQIRPLETIASRLTRVQKGNFDIKMPHYNTREFQEISDSFNSMTAEIKYLIQETYEKQLIITTHELKITQAQMNPHFMFNVLNAIALHARLNNDGEEVCKMITSFSGLLQATLLKSNQEKETVRGELVYVEYYLSLQRLRYGDRLEYKFIFEEDSLLDLHIPKFSIQTLVENAVVHGMEPKTEKSTIIVNVYSVDDDLIIDVTDDGVGFENAGGVVKLPFQMADSSDKHNRIGLNNVNNIIKIIYGTRYGVTIFSIKNEGATVTIRVPLNQNGNQEE